MPRLEPWLGALERELADAAERELVVLCHSLGSVLWLHHAARADGSPARRALLVAPPTPRSSIAELGEFVPPPLDAAALARVASSTRIVYADDDPYCEETALAAYADPLGVPADLIPGGRHVNTDAGYGPWPSVERWALEGAEPVTGNRG